MQFAFAHLNLTKNPFGDLSRDERAGLVLFDTAPLARELALPRTVVQFVADHGRGKTTRLIALHGAFPDAPYVKLERARRVEVPASEILFVDSFEILGWFGRRRVYGKVDSLAVTTHSDRSREFRRAGFRVVSVKVSEADPYRLLEIFQRRVEAVRRADGPIPEITEALVRELVRRFGDDVRAMEGRLYDRFQALDSPGPFEL